MQRQWRSDDTDKWKYGFGDGSDGSSYSVPSNEGCSGSSGGTSLTLAAAGSFSDGDLVLIHQSRGTGAGNWELNKIASGGGTTSLTMEHDLTNSYTDSGDNQAQIIEMKQYDGLTTGSITAPAWTGSDGGIIAFFDKGTCTVSGTVSATGKGFLGGSGRQTSAYQGEGTGGARAITSSANGNGGGGATGVVYGQGTSGGGGGNGTAGQAGTKGGGSEASTVGAAGATAGNAGLTSMVFGGAGGGGANDLEVGGAGGNGGGIIFIFAKEITISGSIASGGNNGTNANESADGGSGAGGSILLKSEIATLGSSLITAAGATAFSNGGVGRIHLDYSDSYTGTTSPTLDATQDDTIVPLSAGGSFLTHFVNKYTPPSEPNPILKMMVDSPENVSN